MAAINNSANAAVLASIRQINNDIQVSQTRIGTGKKVNSAADNASVWIIAQGIRSSQTAQASLSAGITVAKGRADTAVAALNNAVGILGKIKDLANEVTSTNPSDMTASNAKLTALWTQASTALASAGFQGENWLTGTVANLTSTVKLGLNSGESLAASLSKVDDTGTGYTAAAAIVSMVNNAGTETSTAKKGATLAGLIDTAVTQLTSYQTTLSTFSSALTSQQDFLTSLASIRDTALSSLVDADLTEENAKVTALQTQQQLAYQALSIGNSSASSILRLFQ